MRAKQQLELPGCCGEAEKVALPPLWGHPGTGTPCSSPSETYGGTASPGEAELAAKKRKKKNTYKS